MIYSDWELARYPVRDVWRGDELRVDRQEWDQAGGGQGIGPLYLLR